VDITELKKAEEDFGLSEELFLKAFNTHFQWLIQ
jgi:hypothetical protein